MGNTGGRRGGVAARAARARWANEARPAARTPALHTVREEHEDRRLAGQALSRAFGYTVRYSGAGRDRVTVTQSGPRAFEIIHHKPAGEGVFTQEHHAVTSKAAVQRFLTTVGIKNAYAGVAAATRPASGSTKPVKAAAPKVNIPREPSRARMDAAHTKVQRLLAEATQRDAQGYFLPRTRQQTARVAQATYSWLRAQHAYHTAMAGWHIGQGHKAQATLHQERADQLAQDYHLMTGGKSITAPTRQPSKKGAA